MGTPPVRSNTCTSLSALWTDVRAKSQRQCQRSNSLRNNLAARHFFSLQTGVVHGKLSTLHLQAFCQNCLRVANCQHSISNHVVKLSTGGKLPTLHLQAFCEIVYGWQIVNTPSPSIRVANCQHSISKHFVKLSTGFCFNTNTVKKPCSRIALR